MLLYIIFSYKLEISDYYKDADIETVFSAYPGTLSSTDDFYITNNKLMITETTIDVLDINLYSKMKSAEEYIFNFMRVNSASLFSKTAV